MKNINLKKSLVALTTAALVAALAVVIPTTARAAGPDCSGTALPKYPVYDVQLCKGTDQFGAKYEIAMPKKFNGTLIVWSHGIRKNTNLPPIPVVADKGYIVDNSAEIAPSPAIAASLLKQGFALAGSGVQTQGWNLAEQVLATTIVIDQAITTFPAIDRVAAWGASLGGLSTQILAETNPGLVEAAAPLCLAESALSEITMAGDFLWGLKTLFDPSIKAFGYTSGDAGKLEMLTDIQKVLGVIVKLKTAIAIDPKTPKWPSTSPASTAGLQAAPIPVRSAILLLGLVSGISTQSNTYDASSGPKGVPSDETSFGLAISPALAVLENGAQAALLAVVANYDMELRAGGIVYDNSKTNYAARLGDDSDVFAAALSGKSAITGMLSYLSALNPNAPRVTADASAVAAMKALGEISGKITVPTITLTATADHITPPGATQYLVNQYKSAIASGDSKKGLLVNIWNKPADEYTKFVDGKPVTPAPVTNGTEHCNFTDSQFMMIAKMLTDSAKSGKAPTAKTVAAAIKKDKNLFVDPNYTAPLLKARQ
jgi:pimeloyl-ACP methyl ester carboxylesterase